MFGISKLQPIIRSLELCFKNKSGLDTIEGLINSSVLILEQVKIELQIELDNLE